MPVKCDHCARESTRTDAKLPRGWKRIDGITCNVCLKTGWHVRAITLPVVEVMGCDDFFAPFLPAWRLSTDLANWGQRELLKRDVVRQPSDEKLATMPDINLYRIWSSEALDANRAAWEGCTGTASQVLQEVRSKWLHKGSNANRFGVIWLGRTTAATFRWPYPWPVRRQDLRLSWLDVPGGREAIITLRLPGGRFSLRLDSGSGHRRAIRDFEKLVSGEAKLGDAKIIGVMREGRLKGVKVCLAGRFRRAVNDDTAEAKITTLPNALLSIEATGRDEPFVLHFTHLQGLIVAHERRRHEVAVDTKFEKRWPAKRRRRIVRAGATLCDKQDRRIDTAIKQAAAQAVGFVKRQGCGTVLLDTRCREFASPFRWFALINRVETLCLQEGIHCTTLAAEEATA